MNCHTNELGLGGLPAALMSVMLMMYAIVMSLLYAWLSSSPRNEGQRQALIRARRKVRAKCRRFPGIEIVAHEIEFLARQIERSLAEQ